MGRKEGGGSSLTSIAFHCVFYVMDPLPRVLQLFSFLHVCPTWEKKGGVASEAGPYGNWFRLTFCQSVETQPGRARTHLTGSATERSLSLLFASLLPSSPSYGALPSHQSGSVSPPLPSPPTPPPARSSPTIRPFVRPSPQIFSTVPGSAGGSVAASRKLPPRSFF